MRAGAGRRLLLLVALGAAWASGAAPALAAPVDGGGSFDDAAAAPGTFSDTILPQETLFYAVALDDGQRVQVDAEVDLSVGSKGIRGNAHALGGFGLIFYSPLRERLSAQYVGDPFRGGIDLQRDGDTRRLPRVVSAAVADRRKTAGTGAWTGPGIYTFTAAISAIYQDPGAVVEFPLRLRIAIDGPAAAAGAPTPGPLGAAAASASSAPTRGDERTRPRPVDGVARVSNLVVLAAAIAALLAGAMLAGIARRLQQPGPDI